MSYDLGQARGLMNRLKSKLVGSYPVDGGAPESDARLVTGILAAPLRLDAVHGWVRFTSEHGDFGPAIANT